MEAPLPLNIFIVEDNEWYGELLLHQLGRNPDHHVRRFGTARECLEQMAKETPDVVTLDYSLPDSDGEHTLRQLRERAPQAAVVVISGQEDVATAVALLRQGAYDYLVKDASTGERLWSLLGKVRQQVRLRRENEQLRLQLDARDLGNSAPILGAHPTMLRLQELIGKAARTTITVSVSGETGTGKELVAQAIHARSERAGRPFVAVNMAAIPRELLESELFGHEKGAFTGAVTRRVGRFEEADGGTLFLDEVADLELGLQAKLLRVLQERELVRVGGRQRVAFDVRLVVATHHDLLTEVRAGRFREDLYYRLLGLPITLPPLRERGTDVLLLAEAFVQTFCQRNNLPARHLGEDAQQRLLAHPFPGNVRELKAVVELGAVLAEGDLIRSPDLSLRSPAAAAGAAAQSLTLREQANRLVQECLDELGGDVLATADRLGVGKSTIYRMIKHHHVQVR
ncbi:sigma-54-dependent transcriptional regulator [Hymenobacter caeli]|uniref:DNA-binding NtrC family response regulator n=1 Tax=Hymenobacter caeli TaxID=2735894 RepID=A0ABX2FMG8_9BACT|nr:sigma-54 dependent transcriptional regulator [Hymenobacter caeli]NRT18329.1 DNA-binding NtrC family response regulator [Hymenobacter caeli]